jgi:hypothetical protein
MKTQNSQNNSSKGLPVQSSKSVVTTPAQTAAANTATRPQIDFNKRQANRLLGTQELLELLRTQAPRLYELSEVVGKWVWIQFADKQPADITAQLSQFGFHWNNKRQAWQHPCGPVQSEASPADPREKYGSRYAADMQAA